MLSTEQSKAQLNQIRKNISKQNSIFAEKKYLDGLHISSNIIGRDEQTEKLFHYLDDLVRGCLVPVISAYGRSGSGKSTLIKSVCNDVDLACSTFVNLRKANTVFSYANLILSKFDMPPLKSADGTNKVIDEIGKCISKKLESQRKKFMILVLDEYDAIFLDKRNNPADFMYKLLTLVEELREKDQWLCIITISNNALSEYSLDDRTKSRMGSNEIFFPSYTKNEMVLILQDIAKIAFRVKIPNDIILHCAEICSLQYGDARRALDLLRIAGECSDGNTITKRNIDDATSQLEKDKIYSILAHLPLHQRIVMAAICDNTISGKTGITSTFEIFETYCSMVNHDIKPVSYRRLGNFLVDLENTGLIESKTLSRGRGGYGSMYNLCFPPEMIGPLIGAKWWEDVLYRTAKLDVMATYHKIPKSTDKVSLETYLKNHGL